MASPITLGVLCLAFSHPVAAQVTPAVARIGEVWSQDGAGAGTDPLIEEQWGWIVLGCDLIPDLEPHQTPPVVMIHDTGTAPWHEDLPPFDAYAVLGLEPDYIDHPHSTMMASGAAATAQNGKGMAGAFGRGGQHASLKCLSFGMGTPVGVASSMMVGAGLGYKVHSLSLQGPYSEWYDVAFSYLDLLDCIAIVAAGNRPFLGVQWPGAHPRAICISALDPMLTLAPYSSWGPEVDFCAPGTKITSAYPFGGKFTFDQCSDCYVQVDGTSPATALTAGIVARMVTERPTLDRDQTVWALRYTAIDLGQPGWDPQYGWGLIQASAVTLVSKDRADTNRDGIGDIWDTLTYLSWHESGDFRADFTLDGTIDIEDFLAYDRERRLIGLP